MEHKYFSQRQVYFFSHVFFFFDGTRIFQPHVLQFSSFFSDGTKIFHSRVLQYLFFRRHQNFPFTCSAVPFFRQHKFSIHVFCSSFFSDSTNFPFTCSAVPFFPTAPKFSIRVVFSSSFSPTAQIFHSRVLQFLFFRPHQNFHSRGVLQFFFSDGTNFPATCTAIPFFSDSTKIFQPRVASFKLADISTTCDVVYFSFHDDCSSDVLSGSSKTYSLWEISKILQLKSEYVISHVSFSMM